MISDTAISDPKAEMRDRNFDLKIEAVHGQSLIAFAGDVKGGHLGIRTARHFPVGLEAIQSLVATQSASGSVDFAYAYFDGTSPRLFLITDGKALERGALHIGDGEAFKLFQAARLLRENRTAPNAIHTLKVWTKLKTDIPDALIDGVDSFFHFLPNTSERSVAGWPMPYHLSRHGAALCPLVYSVTDPIEDQLAAGDIIPHGSATHGGFAICVSSTERGAAVYWLQSRSGLIFTPNDDWYRCTRISGTPPQFTERAALVLGQEVEVYFGAVPTDEAPKIKEIEMTSGDAQLSIVTAGRNIQTMVRRPGSQPYLGETTIYFDPIFGDIITRPRD